MTISAKFVFPDGDGPEALISAALDTKNFTGATASRTILKVGGKEDDRSFVEVSNDGRKWFPLYQGIRGDFVRPMTTPKDATGAASITTRFVRVRKGEPTDAVFSFAMEGLTFGLSTFTDLLTDGAQFVTGHAAKDLDPAKSLLYLAPDDDITIRLPDIAVLDVGFAVWIANSVPKSDSAANPPTVAKTATLQPHAGQTVNGQATGHFTGDDSTIYQLKADTDTNWTLTSVF